MKSPACGSRRLGSPSCLSGAERPRRRRSSRFSPWAVASAASSRAISSRWWRLSSASWAVSARTTLLCDRGWSANSGSRRLGGVHCRLARRCSTQDAAGWRYRKSIDTPAALASPGKVIGSPLAVSVERGLGALGRGLVLALLGGAQDRGVPARHLRWPGWRRAGWRRGHR